VSAMTAGRTRLRSGMRRPRSERELPLHLTAGVRWRARLLGALAGSTAIVLFAAEFVRVWRLGSLPLSRGDAASAKRSPRAMLRIVREGYSVSNTRENAIVNMVASLLLSLGSARLITYSIRTRGRLGPIKNIQTSGGRHIHHFIPGMAISLLAGGYSIATRREGVDRWLAIPFGVGIALVLDETALLLELEDVYWTEEGRLSLEVASAATALLAASAYGIRVLSRGKPSIEADWQQAASAFDDLQLPGSADSRASSS
jgi:hypothetical protein